MKFQTISTFLVMGAAGAWAQPQQQSPPFSLQIVDSDGDLNGKYVTACHGGAAVSLPCVASSPSAASATFYHNYTSSEQDDRNVPGALISMLKTKGPTGGTTDISLPLALTFNPASNVAGIMFFPQGSANALVGFDSNNKMYIQGHVNEAAFKPMETPKASDFAVYNWLVCWTLTTSYYYQTLAWFTGAVGHDTPINPTCHAVNVTRVEVLTS